MSSRLPLLVVIGLAILWLFSVGGAWAPKNEASGQVKSLKFDSERRPIVRPVDQGVEPALNYSENSGVASSTRLDAEAPNGRTSAPVRHGKPMDPGDSSLWPSSDDSASVSSGSDLDPGDSSLWPQFDSTEVIIHGIPEDPEKEVDWVSSDAVVVMDGLQMDPEESGRWPLSDQTDVIVRGEPLDPDEY